MLCIDDVLPHTSLAKSSVEHAHTPLALHNIMHRAAVRTLSEYSRSVLNVRSITNDHQQLLCAHEQKARGQL